MRRPRPVLVLAAIAAVGVGLLITAALEDTVVYYRTPTEVTQSPYDGQPIRLGGQVMLGSLLRNGEITQFRLTDGHSQLLVIASGVLPDTFREGEGAVVEGTLGADRVFRAGTVAVKHSNEYRPPAQGAAAGPPP